MKRYGIGALMYLVLAGVIGLVAEACAASGGGGGNPAPAEAPRNALAGPVSRAQAAPHVVAGSVTTTTTTTAGGGGGSGAGSSGGVSFGSTSAGAINLPGTALQHGELIGPKVIETAQLSLVTKKDRFDEAFQRANEVAGRYRGYVESSSTEGVKSKFGAITIRVPSTAFQAALRDLRSLGQVTGQSVSGQDVTSQYVDLQARLRNWQAQEQVLLKLMSRATTIGDTLRIQNELSQIQLRIEQLKGQLRVLDNQTSFATIDVSMRESGHAAAPVHKESRSGLAKAWHDAGHGFVGVVSAVVVGLGYLVPISILLALVWLGIRRLRPRITA